MRSGLAGIDVVGNGMKKRKKMDQIWVRAVALLVFFWMSGSVFADVYMYIDDDGVVHFTNAPTASDTEYRVFVREGIRKAYRRYSPDRYDAFIREASELYGVSYPLLKAIIKAESDFNPTAISRKGALGLMQLMPHNVEAMNISDPFDPWENIMGGARYFRSMLDRFEGQLALSLAAYNAGPTAVERYNFQIPPFKETQNYVEKVLKYYYAFRQ